MCRRHGEGCQQAPFHSPKTVITYIILNKIMGDYTVLKIFAASFCFFHYCYAFFIMKNYSSFNMTFHLDIRTNDSNTFKSQAEMFHLSKPIPAAVGFAKICHFRITFFF